MTEDIKEDKTTELVELNIPVIGLVRGIWIMGIGAFSFIRRMNPLARTITPMIRIAPVMNRPRFTMTTA